MFCILTDGLEIYRSSTFMADELEKANAKAFAATDGNLWWEAGYTGNIDYPKCSFYKHIKRESEAHVCPASYLLI